MDSQSFIDQLKTTKDYFDRATRCLEEADSGFAPS